MQCSLKSGGFFCFCFCLFVVVFLSKFCGVSQTTIHGMDVPTPLILPPCSIFSLGRMNMATCLIWFQRHPNSQESLAPPKQGTNPPWPPSANTIRKHAQKSLDESSQRLKAIEVVMNIMLISCKKKTDHEHFYTGKELSNREVVSLGKSK